MAAGFSNLRTRQSGDRRVEELFELRASPFCRAKEKPACEIQNEEEAQEAEGGGGREEEVGNVEERKGICAKEEERKGRRELDRGGDAQNSSNQIRMPLRMVVALLFLLLVKSGDVEVNPGPRRGEYKCIVF